MVVKIRFSIITVLILLLIAFNILYSQSDEEKKEDKVQKKKIAEQTKSTDEAIKQKEAKKAEAIKYYNEAVNKYNQGLYKEAKQYFEKAVEFDAENVKVWYWLASCCYKLDDLKNAKIICLYLINELKVTGGYKKKTDNLLTKIEKGLSMQAKKEETEADIPELGGIVTIHLKDGTVIKGELMSIKENIYKIKTTFGIVELRKENILKIEGFMGDIIKMKNGNVIKGIITKTKSNILFIETQKGLEQINIDNIESIKIRKLEDIKPKQTVISEPVKPMQIEPKQINTYKQPEKEIKYDQKYTTPIKKVEKERIDFIKPGKVGIYLVGGGSYLSMGDINKFNDTINKDITYGDNISLNWGWDWEVGLKIFFSKFILAEVGYGQFLGRTELELFTLYGSSEGKIGEEMHLSYIPINLLLNINAGKLNYQLGGGIGIYNGLFFFYGENSAGTSATYCEIVGSCTGANLIFRVESFSSRNVSLFSDCLVRIAEISEWRDTTYNTTAKLIKQSYGDGIVLSNSSKYENLKINLSGLRLTLGLNIYFN